MQRNSIQLLITGGPGSGTTTAGARISKRLGMPQIDSDDYFHKPTDPPFQVQYSTNERRALIHKAIASSRSWLLSGSISAWGITDIRFSHAVVLNVGKVVRLDRLRERESKRFGMRIEADGDMLEEHTSFLEWASHYEDGDLEGRSLPVERDLITRCCDSHLEICGAISLEVLEEKILNYLNKSNAYQGAARNGGKPPRES